MITAGSTFALLCIVPGYAHKAEKKSIDAYIFITPACCAAVCKEPWLMSIVSATMSRALCSTVSWTATVILGLSYHVNRSSSLPIRWLVSALSVRSISSGSARSCKVDPRPEQLFFLHSIQRSARSGSADHNSCRLHSDWEEWSHSFSDFTSSVVLVVGSFKYL